MTEVNVSDEQLIARILSGERDAFGEIVARYQDRLFNTVLYMLGNTEDAHDIVQETFLQAFVHLDSFRHSSLFYTWLYRIAFNLAIGHLRRRRQEVSIDKIFEERGDCWVSSDDSPDMKSGREENAKILWNAIERLPEEFRTVIILREMENASYEEIGQILNLPDGTVRSRLFRGRNMLKEFLQKYEDELH